MNMNNPLHESLQSIVGDKGLRQAADIDIKHYKDLMGARKTPPLLQLRPASTQELSACLKVCHEHRQPVVPQGGMTGLVSAAAPLEGEIIISFERMNRVLEVDPLTSTMTVEAGVPLQTIQEAAEQHGLMFPLDLGARGSCTIGGNLSTNAGGNRVLRYGMTRDLVVGLEAVLADGTVVDNMHKLRKNNSGYDLKQLFIGSEGTLGIITQAVLKLFPKPSTQSVAFCGVKDFSAVSQLLVVMQTNLGGNLTAFEVLWQNTYQLMRQHVHSVKLPLSDEYGFYVLVEAMGTSRDTDRQLFENALESAIESGLIDDAVLSQSDKDIDNLWAIRDGATEIPRGVGRMHAYDISLAVSQMDYFGEEVIERLTSRWPGAVVSIFGHIGDGNLHILVNVGPDTRQLHRDIDEVIYTLISELKGAISAEHGIGLMKKPFLSYSCSAEQIALMQTLKQALDPDNILSPGRIVDIGS